MSLRNEICKGFCLRHRYNSCLRMLMTSNRTQEERDWWVAYSEDRKRDVLLRCAQREHVLRSGTGDLAPGMGSVESRRKGRTL